MGMIAYVPSSSAASIAPRTLDQSFQRSPTHVCTVWLQHSFPLAVALALLCIQYEYFMLVCLSMIRLSCKNSQCALNMFKKIPDLFCSTLKFKSGLFAIVKNLVVERQKFHVASLLKVQCSVTIFMPVSPLLLFQITKDVRDC